MTRTTDPRREEDWVPEDDAVIGKAFRVSLLVFLAIGAVVALVLFLRSRGDDRGETTEVEATPTRTTEQAVEAPSVPFRDVTRAAGVDFVRSNGATGRKYLPETMGGGVAFLDHDGDGDEDLLLVDGAAWTGDAPAATSPRLYANDGAGSFRDVTAEVGLDFVLQGMGPVVGDVDGDGDLDLFLTGVGRDVLLVNEGGRFVDRTREAGFTTGPEAWGSSGTFFDADGDDDLDLYVCRYVRWSTGIDEEVDYQLTGVGRAYGPPTNYEGAHSEFWRNQGDGTFVEEAAQAGLQVSNAATGVPVGKALGVLAADLDGDGAQDLFVANDTVRNFLFHNDGDGTFTEIGKRSGVAFGSDGNATGAMGVDLANFRNDDAIGFAVGNFAGEMSSLYVSARDLLFSDEAIVEGVGAPSRQRLSFGLFFFDYDLDGHQDLLQVNGHLEDEISKVQPAQTFEQPAQLFWNAGPDARSAFLEVPADKAGDLLARPIVGRACAWADVDADGDLDVVLTQSVGAPLLLRNDQALGHHWLTVRLEQPGANREAIGAWVRLETPAGTQRRLVTRGRSYLAQVPAVAHFGLGTSTEVTALVVTWPDGSEQRVEAPAVDAVTVVRRD